MSLPTSLGAYRDCIALYERALEEGGIRIEVADFNAATYLRMRMHQARSLDRKSNKEIHLDEPDHPMYDRSPFDGLACQIRQSAKTGKYWLYIDNTGIDVEKANIQSLAEVEDDDVKMLPQQATLQLTFQPESQVYEVQPTIKRRL